MKQAGSQTKSSGAQRFGEMSFMRKIGFLGKVVVFLASFGFVYPTLFAD